MKEKLAGMKADEIVGYLEKQVYMLPLRYIQKPGAASLLSE